MVVATAVRALHEETWDEQIGVHPTTMLLGAVVNSACDVADPTVTAIATWVPVASITRTCAVPAVCLAVMASVFPLTPVTTDAVLLLLLK